MRRTDSAAGLFGGRYAVGGAVGVGSSAAVYEAEDTRAGPGAHRRLALKILHPHLAGRAEVREAFLREAGRARQLRHPNVVAVHDCGLHDAGGLTLAWIALDLVEGLSLAEWVVRNGPMTVAGSAAVADGTLAALGAAHRLGIVHRDVTPRNIMLVGDGGPIGGHQVRVLDFGLADAAGGTTLGGDVLLAGGQDAAKTVVGSAHYMSPEQAQGRPITAAADLYQAGAVLYYLLTGQAPYPRERIDEVLAAQVSAPAPVPSALVPAAGPLDRVVTTAMAKDPSRRYRDADAFRAALRGTPAGATDQGGYQPTLVLATARPASRSGAGPAAARTGRRTPVAPPDDHNPALGVAIAGIAVVAVLATLSAALGSQPTRVAAPSPSPTASPASSRSARPSPGPPQPVLVEVPRLYGSLDDAGRALTLAGLKLGRVARVDSAEDAGRVLEQSPDSGLKVAAGSAVNLRVASGFNSVPAVAGLTYEQAVSALRTAGFSWADTVPPSPGLLAGTTPAAGVQARVGTAIGLDWAEPSTAPSEPSPAAGPPSPTPSAGG